MVETKKKNKGKGKGGSGERTVARILTKWITGKSTPEVLWRSAMSGGKATMAGVKRHTMAGDFVAIDSRAQFLTGVAVLEVKNRKPANVLDFLPLLPEDVDCLKVSKGAKTRGKRSWKNTIYCWWMKLCEEAKEAEKIPILIFKRFQTKRWYIVFDTDNWVKLRAVSRKIVGVTVLMAVNQAFRCVVVNMDDFVGEFSVQDFKDAFPVRTVEKYRRVRGYGGYDLQEFAKRKYI